MLYHYLIPLHKLPQEHTYYHQQLHYCMILFAGKDHTFTRAITRGLLRYWYVVAVPVITFAPRPLRCPQLLFFLVRRQARGK